MSGHSGKKSIKTVNLTISSKNNNNTHIQRKLCRKQRWKNVCHQKTLEVDSTWHITTKHSFHRIVLCPQISFATFFSLTCDRGTVIPEVFVKLLTWTTEKVRWTSCSLLQRRKKNNPEHALTIEPAVFLQKGYTFVEIVEMGARSSNYANVKTT